MFSRAVRRHSRNVIAFAFFVRRSVARCANARWRRFSLARHTHPSNARERTNRCARARVFFAASRRRVASACAAFSAAFAALANSVDVE